MHVWVVMQGYWDLDGVAVMGSLDAVFDAFPGEWEAAPYLAGKGEETPWTRDEEDDGYSTQAFPFVVDAAPVPSVEEVAKSEGLTFTQFRQVGEPVEDGPIGT